MTHPAKNVRKTQMYVKIVHLHLSLIKKLKLHANLQNVTHHAIVIKKMMVVLVVLYAVDVGKVKWLI